MKSENLKHIVVYRTRGIGDVILSFQGLHLLERNNAKIYFIGYGPGLKLISHYFPHIQIVDIGKHGLRQSFNLVNDSIPRVDAFIDLQMNSRSNALIWLLWLKYAMPVFRWNKKSMQKMMVVRASRITGRKRQLRIVNDFKLSPIQDLMTDCFTKCIHSLFENPIVTNDSDEEKVPGFKKKNNPNKILAIAPGGSHQAKQAPASLIVKIVNQLLTQSGPCFEIQLLGDENDYELCKQIEDAFNKELKVKNFSGTFEINQLPVVLENCDALLATDSAIAHLANYLNVPSAVLAGPTIEGFGYAVERNHCKVFSTEIFCRPCSRTGKTDCIYKDNLCFEEINTLKVSEYLGKFLEK